MDRDEDPLEFRHVDSVKFEELIADLRLDYEEECWPILRKLVRSWSWSRSLLMSLLMSSRQGETSQYEGICVAWQAESQQNVYVRSSHGPRRCVNE